MLNIEQLNAIQATGLINFRKLIESSGLNYSKIMSKLSHNRQLDVDESNKIQNILNKLKALI